MKRSDSLLFLLVFFLASCTGGIQLPLSSASLGAPSTWIDKPLPGSQFLIEPIELLVHANDPQGVSAVAFSVNGQLVEALPAGEASPFVTMPHVWTPSAGGEYTLSFAAQNVNGTWGENSEVTITVLESLPEEPEFLLPDTPPDVPPTAVPPTTVPIIPVTPTATFTNTAPPPPPTTQPPPSDTEKPVITSLVWDPITPNEDEQVSFAVTATDDDRVARIEIYFVRQGDTAQGPIAVCESTSVCEYQALSGFQWGMYTYYAIAYDPAGNSVSSFTQTVQVLQVVK